MTERYQTRLAQHVVRGIQCSFYHSKEFHPQPQILGVGENFKVSLIAVTHHLNGHKNTKRTVRLKSVCDAPIENGGLKSVWIFVTSVFEL